MYSLSKLGVINGVSEVERASTFKLKTNNERIVKIMQEVMCVIATAQRNNIISAPAPIVSRVFQVLSEGHERGVMTARKVAETPFPMPFAQVIEILVLIFTLLCLPLVLSSYLSSSIAAGTIAFLTSLAYVSLNVVGRMLEEPFGADHNDLPLGFLQWEFNRRLIVIRGVHGSSHHHDCKTANIHGVEIGLEKKK